MSDDDMSAEEFDARLAAGEPVDCVVYRPTLASAQTFTLNWPEDDE